MSLPSYFMSIRSFSWSRVFCGFTFFAVLSLSGCRPSGGLSMTVGELDATPDYSAVLMEPTLGEPTSDPPPARFEGANTTATDQPVLLAPRAHQLCDTVTIAPGTEIHIPYVLPIGWHYVAHEVHVVQAITEPEQDYHRVEPLPADFSFSGTLRKGYMLLVQVPAASALQCWSGKA